METDYLSMCKNFYAATKIPVTLLKGKYAVYTSFNDITGNLLHTTVRISFP